MTSIFLDINKFPGIPGIVYNFPGIPGMRTPLSPLVLMTLPPIVLKKDAEAHCS